MPLKAQDPGGLERADDAAQAPLPVKPRSSSTLLVRLRAGARVVTEADGRQTLRAPDASRIPALDAALAARGATTLRPTLTVTPARADRAAALGLDRWVTIDLPEGSDMAAIAEALRHFPEVIELAEVDVLGGVTELLPNDPSFGLQYALRNIGQFVSGQQGVPGADVEAASAWEFTTGEDSVVIAVLDSGVTPHLELGVRVLPGWNVPQQNTDTQDGCSSHGTHVAGIAAATGDNGIGIAGLAWNATILPVVVVSPCSGNEAWVADGLIWAADQEADIINMSLQYSSGTTYLHDAVQYAAASGALLVAATGNSNAGVAYPAKWPETIAVAATTNQDLRWANSNFGPEVDVAAPGWQIYSLIGSSGYGYKSGTSMAAPHVSGIAALLLALDDSLTAPQLREIIESTAEDVEGPGFDSLTGHGRVNAASALVSISAPPIAGDLNGDGAVDAADLGILLAAWGPCPDCDALPCPADLDYSCVVDGADLGLLLIDWTG
jgi:subtilisin family serine protease